MGAGIRSEVVIALAWLVFPMVPVLLEETYYQICTNLVSFDSSNAGPEPRDWRWETWLMMLGPLLGYGFLVGTTADVSDEMTGPKKGLRRVVARRAVWVAIGPWSGFVFLVAIFLGLGCLSSWLPQSQGKAPPGPAGESWVVAILSWIWTGIFFGIFAYGWLWPAWAALERAGRIGLWRRALYRGLVTALAFVGSLFGSFWAITSSWRTFFFDPRVMPMIALALGLSVLSGCSSTITYGEMRRRELFHAMLLAWVFGLALIWWWSSRRRRRGPRRADAPSGELPSS